ncbi:hypothetical protein KFE98_16060 [bacterium SCSIO 12741]|nr:hypothetical protein KFE98_16060 [bacterium SCSIO 12741]
MNKLVLLTLLLGITGSGLRAQISHYREYGKSLLDLSCVQVDVHLDNNSNDNGPNSYTSSRHGTSTASDGSGYLKKALRFDGVDDYIEFTDGEPLVSGGPFTLTINAKLNGQGGGASNESPLFSQRSASNSGSLINCFADNGNNQIEFVIRDKNQSTASSVTYPAPGDGEWHSYGFVLNENDSIFIYLDGVKVAGSRSTQSAEELIGDLDYISLARHCHGDGTPTNEGWLNGDLDNFRVFSCALSPSDIQIAHGIKLTAIADVTYYSNINSQANLASSVFLRGTAKVAGNGTDRVERTLLRFDDLGDSLPTDIVIDSAQLDVYVKTPGFWTGTLSSSLT